MVSEKVTKTTDPIALNTIPSLSLLQQWNSHLSFFEKEAQGYYYLEHGSHRYSTANLQDMVKIDFARDVQKAVQAELNWFCTTLLETCQYGNVSTWYCNQRFQDLLYTRPFDEIHQEYQMTPDEMAKFCVNFSSQFKTKLLLWLYAIKSSLIFNE